MKPIDYRLTEDGERLGSYEVGTNNGKVTYINCIYTEERHSDIPVHRRSFAKLYQIYLVEQAQGHLIESNQRVHFKDWNTKNFNLDNLVVVTARELHDLKMKKLQDETDKKRILRILMGK